MSVFDRGGPSPAHVLRYRHIKHLRDERQRRTLSGLCAVQGAATPPRTDGYTGPIHLLGGGRGGRSHRRLHPRLLPCGIRGRTGHAGRCPLDGYRTHHLQTAERTAQQEGGPRRVRLCLLASGMTVRNHHGNACGYIDC